ncbi:MAG: thiamine pyrophosphate-dependent enzyme [Acidobacteriaceae bacterium]|nr:thiamine pyrophosphate-dependent enzyme [Acidobacteriaceae bacterium]
MAENPLLPHRKLQELYRLVERCSKLEKKQMPGGREAILAATTIHLQPGDLLSHLHTDFSAEEVAPLSRAAISDDYTPKASRLIVDAATARGFRRAGTQSLVLAYAEAATLEDGWGEALAFAQTERLPFVLFVADRNSRSIKPKALNWANVSPLCKKLQLPTLSVDGEDAVAVFRVMQECALRARTGLGPAVAWAMLSPAGTRRTVATSPLSRLKRYMAQREIPLPR